MDRPPLHYLSAADVAAAMPPAPDRLALAERAMLALTGDAQLPPKIGVYPGPLGSFGHAMPAWARGPDPDGSADLLGMKWVVGFPENTASSLPAIHGTVIVNDAQTGEPRAILDAGAITAHRTAAVAGLAVARWGPHSADGPVAILGTGVQARSHLAVLDHLMPGTALVLCGRDPGSLKALAAEVEAGVHGHFGAVRQSDDLTATVDGASLVLALISFGPQHQLIDETAFHPEATIVAADYDMCVPASLARSAALFLTDDRGQFLADRSAENFVDYPEPGATLGEAIRDATPRPHGRVLITHLGVGLADVVFADAILQRAEAEGIGTVLER